MRPSLVSTVILGLASAVLAAPPHPKHTPCNKNTTDIGSYQATSSGQLRGQGQFLGLHPTTTTTATATQPPPGEERAPCHKKTTNISSHRGIQSKEVKSQFLGLHPTTTTATTATATQSPPGEEQAPDHKNTTNISSHQAVPSKEVESQFLGLHPTTTATATQPPPGEKQDEATVTATKAFSSTPPPESTPQKSIGADFQPLKPTTTRPAESSPESSPTSDPPPEKGDTGSLKQPKGDDKSDDQSLKHVSLTLHNEFRAKHGVDPLVYNETLAAYAQAYVNNHTCFGDVTYSKWPYGINLAKGTSTVEELITAWYEGEEELYNYESPGWFKSTREFTQIIWKNATQLGCAQRPCKSRNDGIYLCCNYDVGNDITEFEENVPTPTLTLASTPVPTKN